MKPITKPKPYRPRSMPMTPEQVTQAIAAADRRDRRAAKRRKGRP